MDKLRKHKDRLIRHRSEDEQGSPPVCESGDSRQTPSWTGTESLQKISSSNSNSPSGRDSSFSRLGNTSPDTKAVVTSSSTTNPLGLTLVHAGPCPALDLVFIHGLGGTSRGTWSWERNPANFWPVWLGNDVELSKTRIFTYGYDAAFAGQYTISTILDFAKDLLFRLKTHSGDGQEDNLPLGSHPIVFVVHSLGGLVVKKAYIIGKSDPQFAQLIASVFALVFLATPHKGTEFGETLNMILKLTPGGCPKSYVAELERNSCSLQEINEQFRNVCGELELVSFYETLKTPVGPGMKRLIVARDSALLEYPGETSSSLVADHHGMSKFKNTLDSNYGNIKNVLRWLMRQILSKTSPSRVIEPSTPLNAFPEEKAEPPDLRSCRAQIKNFLGISSNTEEDLNYFSDRIMHGSCQWILQRQRFQDWAADNSLAPPMLWLSGNPGSGKSTLASFVINSLKDKTFAGACQYYFFQAGHQTKRTISYFLRSIAYQAALSDDEFAIRLRELQDNTKILMRQQKPSIIWEKVFEGVLFRVGRQEPFFWVIDGVDESESPSDLIKILSRIRSATRINVLLVSRTTKELLKDINDNFPAIVHEVITREDTVEDIKAYVRSSIYRILDSESAPEDIVQEVLSKASGSFLWVKLALDSIRDNWYTRDDIRSALTETPEGMDSMYERMIEMMQRQLPKPREMAIRILTWVACSFRPLDISELEVALQPEFSGFVNLRHMVEEICGDFVVINRSKVCLLHETARQFLLRKTPKSISPIQLFEQECHRHVATVCITFLSDSTKLRRIFSSIQTKQQSVPPPSTNALFDEHPFLLYALSFWAYHVSLASDDTEDFLADVLAFLENHCLLWINGVALTGNLRLLTRSAQQLKKYIKKKSRSSSGRPPKSFGPARDGELSQWANDLIRVVGRFGNAIAENPAAVHKYVVPFCPADSIIHRSFHHVNTSVFKVTGLSSKKWDDCQARLNLGDDQIACKILCKDTYFITLMSRDGILIAWHAETCDEARRIVHGEYVTHMASSKTSSLVATAGFKTIRAYDITTGEELHRFPRQRHHHTRELEFGDRDDDLYIAYDDCSIECYDLAANRLKWTFVAKDLVTRGHNCPRYVSFSPDLSQIALVFRARPVVVWNIQPNSSSRIAPKKCILREDKMQSAAKGDAWNAPERAVWHPITYHLLILYEDTKVVDWDIADDVKHVYSHTSARTMVISPDGNLLLTSDANGTLSLWMIPEYRLAYRLLYDELVTDLTFSSDGTRFYDIRGMFCNVWEPDALIRPNDVDRDDMSSGYETNVSELIIANDDNTRVPITAVACDSHDRYFACGKEDGSVSLHEILDGTRVRKVTNHSSSSSVIKLAWSRSGKYLASGDDSGKIIVKRLEPPTAEKNRWSVYAVLDMRFEEAIKTFLFSSREDFLLVAGPTTICVMALKTKIESARKLSPIGNSGVWVNHPSNSTILMGIDESHARQFFWATLDPVSNASDPSCDSFNSLCVTKPLGVVQQAIEVKNQWLVLEMVPRTNNNYARSQRRHVELIDLNAITNPTSPLQPRHSIGGFSKHVRHMIGSFEDRVVFLDHQFSLCTWEIEPEYTGHKKHFPLPQDWLSPTTLRLMVLNQQGTFFCPKNGEVAIVQSGLHY